MTIKATQGFSPDQFWDQAFLPSADAVNEQPDRYGRYLFDPSDIQAHVEVATFGGTHYSGWTFTAASAGTLIKTTPRAMILDAASSTADQGPAVQRVEPILTVVAGKKYGMLTRFKVTDTITKCQYLIGLAEVLTAFHASGVIVDELVIGVGHDVTSIAVDDNGAFLMTSNAGADVEQNQIGEITEATELWAGFVADGATSAKGWINGVWDDVDIATDQLPAAGSVLYPSVDCLSEGTNDPILEVTHLEYRWEQDMTI